MQKLKNMMQKTSNRVIAVALAAVLVFGAAAAGITATLAADGDIFMEFPQPNSATPLAISAAGAEVKVSDGGNFSAEVSNPFSASYRIDGDGAVYIKALATAAPGVVSLGMSTRNSMLSSVPFQLYDPNGLKSVTLSNGAKLSIPSKTNTDYNANSIVNTDPAGFDKSKITWSLPYASDVLSSVAADGTITPKDNGTAMIIGTVTDRWGVKRTIPVMVLVGPQVKIIDGADGKHYAETDATDGGEIVYVEVTPGGKVKSPVKYWKYINQNPPTQVWPDPENPGEWVDTEPACLCGDGCACDNGGDCGCGCEEDCTCGDPTPPTIGDGGAGSTEILIELVEGYTIGQKPVVVNGNPVPEVSPISGHPNISWDRDSSSVVVAPGLTAAMGPYYASFEAFNSEGRITFNVTVKVTTGSVGPSIDGTGVSGNNVNITLYENYSTHTHAITIGGNPAPTVSKVAGGNAAIDITGGNVVVDPGLAVRAAPYTAQFVLSNSVSDLTITVSVTVTNAPSEPSISGDDVVGNKVSISLTEGYSPAHTKSITIGGYPAPTVTKVDGGNDNISMNASGVITVATGLAASETAYAAEFVVANASGSVTVLVEVMVSEEPLPDVGTGIPNVATGRTFTDSSGTWIEIGITANEKYSLILRTAYISQGKFSSASNAYEGSDAQDAINDWYKDTSKVPASDVINRYAVRNNVISENKMGTWNGSITNASGFSAPIASKSEVGEDDVAFLLSYQEAAKFCCTMYYPGSGNYVERGASEQPYVNWTKLATYSANWWLRSPNGGGLVCGVNSSGGVYHLGYPVTTTVHGFRPALWVVNSQIDWD